MEWAIGAAGILPSSDGAVPSAVAFRVQRLTLFDGRFDRAKELALDIAGGGPIRNIGGDPTDIAPWLTSTLVDSPKPHLLGVTAESIPFCLSNHDRRAELVIHRLDRDLFAWSLRAS